TTSQCRPMPTDRASCSCAPPRPTGRIAKPGDRSHRGHSGRGDPLAGGGRAGRQPLVGAQLDRVASARVMPISSNGEAHTTGVGYVYLNDLEQNDVEVLAQIIAGSYAALTAGTYSLGAREGGRRSAWAPVGRVVTVWSPARRGVSSWPGGGSRPGHR